MQFLTLLTLAVGAIAAAVPRDVQLEKRTIISNDFLTGGCKNVVMVYARGSTEPGNLGTLGPGIESALDKAFPNNFAMQGVNYAAGLLPNLLPDGSSRSAIEKAKGLFQSIYTQCPNSRIISGGYSQGSAVIAQAIEELSVAIRNRIDGVVFFGYSQNKQNNGLIPGYPADKLLVICAPGDLICEGTLIVLPAHLTYLDDVPAASNFLISKVRL